MRLELNVPVEAFPAVRMHEFKALEAMLLAYGNSHGFVKEAATQLPDLQALP